MSAGVGTVMVALSPTVSGTVTSYSVTPALPAGLSLDTNGAISGTPTAAAAQANYTITATNVSGSVSFQISLTVNGAPGEGAEDPGLFEEIQSVWSTLPAAAQASIQPYLLRPTDPGSPFTTGSAAATAARRIVAVNHRQIADTGPIPQCQNWVWTFATLGFIKVWTCHTTDAEDQAVFAAVTGVFDRHWDEMTLDMGEPRRDDGHSGDDSVDVYVIDLGDCLKRNGTCTQIGTAGSPSANLALCVRAAPAAPADRAHICSCAKTAH